MYLTGTAARRGPCGRNAMLEQIVKTAYKEFTLRFYHELFARFQDQETGLTAAEIFAAEAIRALGSPTVNEFADFMHVSTPNAAYKINSLVRKDPFGPGQAGVPAPRHPEVRDLLRRGGPRPERRRPHPGALFPRGVRQIRRDALGHQRRAAALRGRTAGRTEQILTQIKHRALRTMRYAGPGFWRVP